MPRLPPTLLRRAHAIDALLPLLLRTCRDLESARNELRWLREHVAGTVGSPPARWGLLRRLCADRARGKPLQFILGTEYFGDIGIRCRQGVLIPRPETAASVTHLVDVLHSSSTFTKEPHPTVRVLDLCTGTGCIPLLLHQLLRGSLVRLSTLGIDISPQAVTLARLNARRLFPEHHHSQLHFARGDVLQSSSNTAPRAAYGREQLPSLPTLLSTYGHTRFDILTANPPYVSPRSFALDTARSVRNFEPRLALVPPPPPHAVSAPATAAQSVNDDDAAHADRFYAPLLRIAADVGARLVLLEVADTAQAVRVARRARAAGRWATVEIWRDEPGASTERGATMVEGFRARGRGHGRSVFCAGAGAVADAVD